MKAKFFFLGLCALGLMACSIDEVSQVNDTNAIQFKATTATRATVNTTNNLQAFTVWAWNDSNLFMDHVTANKQSNGTFTTSPYYFWPTGTVDFYALAPVALDDYGVDNDGNELAYIGGSITVETDLDGNDIDVYTGNVATADIAKDNITIEAYIPGRPKDQIDLIYAISKEKSSGSVTMNFRHALSQVVFKAKDINSDFVVDIAEASICSVNRHGTYTLNSVSSTTTHLEEGSSTDPASGSQGVWSGVNHKTRFTTSNDDAARTGQTLATDGTVVDITDDPLLLIPQQVEAWEPLTDADDSELGAYIVVLCHVTEHGSTLWPNANETDHTVTIDETEYAYIAMPVEVDWEEGYRYTYTIIFGNGLGYYPPDDDNFDLEGTPVLVPITFNVTVDEFQDAEGVDVKTDTDLSYIEVSSAAELEGAVRMGYQEIDVVLPEGETTSTLTLDGYLGFNSDCTLNIASGVTITGPNGSTEGNAIDHNGDEGSGGYSAIIYVNGCNLTITGDGTVRTTGDENACLTNAIWVVNGTVTVYGGTFVGSNWDYSPTSTSWSKHAVYCGEGGYAYLYGGTYSCGYTYVSYATDENGYWVLNCHNSSEEAGHAMIYCYGGTYVNFDPSNPSTDDAKSYVAEGYWSVDNGDGTYTVSAVPTNTPLSVSTASSLRDAVNAGATDITVTQSMTLTDDLRVTGTCTLTLDENVVITPCNEYTSGNPDNLYAICIRVNGGDLTVDANDGAGIMTDGGDDGHNTLIFGVYEGGNLTINSGTYGSSSWNDSTNYSDGRVTVYAYEGFITINGGTFRAGYSDSFKSYGWKVADEDNLEAGYRTNGWTEACLNCNDATRKTGESWIYVKGGKFHDFDPACNPVEGASTNFVVEGYESKMETDGEGNWFVVTEKQ